MTTRDRKSDTATTTFAGKAPDIDFDAEHRPDVAYRASGMLLRRHIQKLANAAASTEDTHAAAGRGIASPTTSLPFADQIQASFGVAHDVSKIQAHVGGDSAAAMGANAFATGNHVVFDRAPDLHTAAHEAAHVVQQAHGVNLYGGVGEAGDGYERHADAVADRVVAGQSAADMLGHAGGGSSTQAIQKDELKELQADSNLHSSDALETGLMRSAERIQRAAMAVEAIINGVPSGDAGVDPLMDRMEDHYDVVDAELDRIVRELHDWTAHDLNTAKLASALNYVDGATITFERNYLTNGQGFAKKHGRDLPTSHPNRHGQVRHTDLLRGRLATVHQILKLDPVGAHAQTLSKSQLAPTKSRTVESFETNLTAIESAAAFLEASGGSKFDEEARIWSRIRSHFSELVAFVETASSSEISQHKPAIKKIAARYDALVAKLGATHAFGQVRADLKPLRDRLGAY